MKQATHHFIQYLVRTIANNELNEQADSPNP